MTPSAEFVFRLPSAAAIGLSSDVSQIQRKPTSRGLFSASTQKLVQSLDTFEADGTLKPVRTAEHHMVGTVEEIAEWVRTSKPRHWTAMVRHPGAAGSLWHLHWLRAVCSDMFLGGQVDEKASWCLCLRGTMDERCQQDPDGAIDRKAVSENEYLNIAVAEGTAILLQLYTDRKWNV